MATPIAEELHDLETYGVEVYDDYHKTNSVVLSPVLCFLSDNPRASEICNHLGSSANKFCRMCLVSMLHNDNGYIIFQIDSRHPATLDNPRFC